MHRMTINLEKITYHELKTRAHREGKSIAKIIQELINFALRKNKKKSTMNLPLHKNNGPHKEIDISDRTTLYDIMEKI